MPRTVQAPPVTRQSTLKPKGDARDLWSDMDEHADQQAEGVVTSEMPFSAMDTDVSASETQDSILNPSTTADGVQVDLDKEDQRRPT